MGPIAENSNVKNYFINGDPNSKNLDRLSEKLPPVAFVIIKFLVRRKWPAKIQEINFYINYQNKIY